MNAINEFLDHDTKPNTDRPGVWWIRLHPYMPKAGHKLQTVTFRKFRTTLRERKGWYQLEDPTHEFLEALRDLHDEPGNSRTLKACQIHTREEAAELDRQAAAFARVKRNVRASAEDPNVLRTSDLPSSRESRRASAREASGAAADARHNEADAKAARRSQELSKRAGELDSAQDVIADRAGELDLAEAELEERRQDLAALRKRTEDRETQLRKQAAELAAEELEAQEHAEEPNSADDPNADPWDAPDADPDPE